MQSNAIWITGPTRSGRTTRLVELFKEWVQKGRQPRHRKGKSGRYPASPSILVFAANDDNRRELADRLAAAIQGRYPVLSKTPLGFFQDEVMLFWPLLIQRLNLRAQFPLRLRPETEQELATKLWEEELEKLWQGVPIQRKVRRILDLLQLAALSGTPVEDIPAILEQGVVEVEESSTDWHLVGQLLLRWRQWCLELGLLTYGIICDLYSFHLLKDLTYQQHLMNRYQAVLADDVDDYPAIARDLFDLLLNKGAAGAFSYNPTGAVRLGWNADPKYLEDLSSRCLVETLSQPPANSLAPSLEMTLVEGLSDPSYLVSLPPSLQSIQTTSRAALLRQTCETIAEAIRLGQVQPQDIAIITPGSDPISRYTIIDILTSKGIPVESLNDQRPLISSPIVRGLLTLLALVYPGLGRLVDRDAVAEMLVVLTQSSFVSRDLSAENQQATDNGQRTTDIDPVRAGLLADYCYVPDIEQPRLLPPTAFPRWDRLGHRATAAYEKILQWLEVQRSQQEQHLIPSCVALLDRAIQQFLWNGSNLPFDQLSALRELMETAQHYWEVDARLRQASTPPIPPAVRGSAAGGEIADTPPHTTIGRLIQLLRQGTITANPYPVRPLGPSSRAITLATIFQYRAARRFHRWHFWLDAGSSLWSKGSTANSFGLFGAPLFLKEWSGRPWTAADEIDADEQRLQRILRDLLGRVGEKIYLCHSELATNGQEQTGPLLSLVNASVSLGSDLALI